MDCYDAPESNDVNTKEPTFWGYVQQVSPLAIVILAIITWVDRKNFADEQRNDKKERTELQRQINEIKAVQAERAGRGK